MRTSRYEFELVTTSKNPNTVVVPWPPYHGMLRLSDGLVGGYDTTYDQDPPFGWVNCDWKVIPGINSTLQGLRLLRYDSKESVSSVSWNIDRKLNVSYSPRGINLKEYLRPPIKPVFKPYRFRPLKAPKPPALFVLKKPRLSKKALAFQKRVNDLRTKKFLDRMKRYEDLSTRRQLYLKKYREDYSRKLQKYGRRLEIFKRRQSIVKQWREPRRLVSTRNYPYPDNPYLKFSLELLDGPGLSSWHYDLSGSPLPHLLSMYTATQGVSSVDDSVVNNAADSTRRIAILTTSTIREELDVKLTRKFYDKLSNQKVHVGNIIAERAQTISLLRESSLRLLNLIKLKRKLFSSLGRFVTNPKMIGNDYLAFQFGFRPLMHDIFNSFELLMDDSESAIDGVHIAIRTNSRQDVSIDTGGVQMYGKLSRSYVAKFEVENPFSRTANSYGILNPAEIAWEVLPWSFVVDWFLPVGAWIGSLSAFAGINYTTGVASEKFQGTIKISNPAMTPIYDGSQLTPCIGTYALKYHERTLIDIPGSERLLRVKNPLSWTHGFESLALLAQKVLK